MPLALEGWCKKRAHLLVFCGALIVFLTFVFKEGLRERWKAIVEQINSAQGNYRIMAELTRNHEQVETLLIERDRTVVSLSSDSSDLEIKRAILLSFDSKGSIHSLEGENADTEILLKILPANKGLEDVLATVKGLLSKVTKDASDFDTRLEEFRRTEFGANPRVIDRWREEQIRGLFEKAGPISNSLAEVEKRSTKLKADVLEKAEVLRSTNERYSSYAWWISTCLFALGWSLGLLGKLYGVPEAAGGE